MSELPFHNRSLPYSPALDGLRGIAVLLVLAAHLYSNSANLQSLFPGGILGVDIFFVLSGYLITSILICEGRETGALNLRRFFLRRAARLLPGLMVLLLVVNLLAALGWKPFAVQEILAAATLSSVFYFANFLFAIRCGNLGPLGHMWSLSVEEQFYLLAPFALVAGLKRRLRAATMIQIAAAAYIVCYLVRAWSAFATTLGTCDLLSTLALPQTRLGGLLVGSIVAFVWTGGEFKLARSANLAWLGIASLPVLLICLLSSSFDSVALYRWKLDVFWIATGSLVLSLVNQPEAGVAKLIGNPVLKWFGKISYSLYLWHFPVIQFVFSQDWKFPSWTLCVLAVTVSILVSAASYQFIEEPVRSLIRRNERKILKIEQLKTSESDILTE